MENAHKGNFRLMIIIIIILCCKLHEFNVWENGMCAFRKMYVKRLQNMI